MKTIALFLVSLVTVTSTLDAQVGNPPPRGPGGPGKGRGGPRAETPAMFEANTVPKDDAEAKILKVLDDINQNQRQGTMIVPKSDGRILRVLTESLGAKNVVEIGTSVGHSGIWICLGLRQTGGKLTTFDIDEGRSARAKENFKRAGVDNLVTQVLGDAHETVKKLEGPIDLLFLDADKEGYLDYLQQLLPKVRPGGLVVAHNMNTRQADPRYIAGITKDPNLETLFINLETSGVAISMKKR